MEPYAYKILLVDDMRSNIETLCQALQDSYKVIIAKSGSAALEKAAKEMPDLILLDLLMPGLDGCAVLTALKESEATRAIPVIIITCLNSVENEEKGFHLGAVDYITKPFHKSVVKARIATHIRILEQIRIIEQLGLMDALTNIPNRRGFDNQLSMEWSRAIREKKPISLIIMDADYFKNVNDTYGHQYGDAVLKKLAEIIKSTVKRPGDFFARWGGEEFALLLPHTKLAGAIALAEAIRTNIEKSSKVTVSLGVTAALPTTESDLEEFVGQADQALYCAKESGRNQICVYD